MGYAFSLGQDAFASLQRRLRRGSLGNLGLQLAGALLNQVFQVGADGTPTPSDSSLRLVMSRILEMNATPVGASGHGTWATLYSAVNARRHRVVKTSHLDVPDHVCARCKCRSDLTVKASEFASAVANSAACLPMISALCAIAVHLRELLVAGQDAARLVHDADAVRGHRQQCERSSRSQSDPSRRAARSAFPIQPEPRAENVARSGLQRAWVSILRARTRSRIACNSRCVRDQLVSPT